jgi:hypothetical protein
MPNKCSICSHPNCAEIDSLLDGHAFKKDIAKQFPGVSVHALSRHGRGLCRADSLDVEETKWAARLEKTFQQAVTDADVRGQQQVASTALRHVRERKAAKAKAAKAKAEEESDGRISIGDLDSLVEVITNPALLPDPVDRQKLARVVERAHGLMRPDAEAVFLKMWENQQFCNDLIDYARDWKQKEESNEPVLEKDAAPN